MNRKPFLPTTIEAHGALTEVYDFLWPTAIALWNLRWQVAGYCAVRSDATEPELRARFVEGSALSGANLRRACLDTSWNDQAEKLAAVLLTNLFAIYEGWTKRAVALLALPKAFEVKLQRANILAALAQRPAAPTLLQQTIYPLLQTNTRYDQDRLDNWMLCYRYFKEVRNNQLHNHGVADKTAENAYAAFVPVATPAALGIGHVPRHHAVTDGSSVRLSLRGVVGFGEILLRLLITLDAELSREPTADALLEARWRSVRTPSHLFKQDPAARRAQMARMFTKLGYSGVAVTPAVEADLRNRGLANW